MRIHSGDFYRLLCLYVICTNMLQELYNAKIHAQILLILINDNCYPSRIDERTDLFNVYGLTLNVEMLPI